MHSFIKWTGSKRPQAEWILSMFPKCSGRYCEMFLGSGIVLLSWLKIHPDAVCIANDLCAPLIRLWEACRDRPDELARDYREMWNEFNSGDVQWQKDVFARIRSEFNQDQTRASHFLFLTRTAINGLVRFNSRGLYNSPLHFMRPGLDPVKMTKLLNECSALTRNVEFRCGSYEGIQLNENDFCYMDPPYAMTGNSMYLGGFDNEKFYAYVEKMPCKMAYVIQWNGKRQCRGRTAGTSLQKPLAAKAVPEYILQCPVWWRGKKKADCAGKPLRKL